EITITTISGALPEPRIQFTFTLFTLSTANSVAMIASTTSRPVRPRSRRLRPLARGWPSEEGRGCADTARPMLAADGLNASRQLAPAPALDRRNGAPRPGA